MIQRVVSTNIVRPSSKWSTTITRSSITKMSFDYHVMCDENYYGDECDRFCRARDDQFGHFFCTKNGTRKCIEGWRGEYCDEGKMWLLLPHTHAYTHTYTLILTHKHTQTHTQTHTHTHADTHTHTHIRGTFNKFPDFFVQAFKIVVDSFKFSMLLLYSHLIR